MSIIWWSMRGELGHVAMTKLAWWRCIKNSRSCFVTLRSMVIGPWWNKDQILYSRIGFNSNLGSIEINYWPCNNLGSCRALWRGHFSPYFNVDGYMCNINVGWGGYFDRKSISTRQGGIQMTAFIAYYNTSTPIHSFIGHLIAANERSAIALKVGLIIFLAEEKTHKPYEFFIPNTWHLCNSESINYMHM